MLKNGIQAGSSTHDFRTVLQHELMRRCGKNPKYSLRAFSKSLGIQAPTLSHLLRGSRKLTPALIQKLGVALGMGPADLQKYVMAPQQEAAANAANLSQLAMDSFIVISDWYHFAILELVNLPHFRPNPRWIAKVLGITVSEVNMAVERLVRLELLRIDKKKWVPSSQGNTTIGAEFTTVALRKVQRQFLEKAITALEDVAIDKRDHSGMTLAVELKDIPEIKQRIKAFRRSLMEFAERNKTGDEIYQLGVTFFPLTKCKEYQ